MVNRAAFLRGMMLAILFGLSAGPIWGQNESSTPADAVEPPLLVFHSTNANRLRQNARTMFATAGRDDMLNRVDEWIKTSLGDLKGLDVNRPFGVMAYLKPGLAGLAGIGYVPVENVDDLLKTLTSGSGNYQKVDGKPNRYKYTNAFDQTFLALERNHYLFIVSEDEDAELDRNFPDPEKFVSRLNSRYDLAVSLQIKSIPPATRQVFVSFLQTQSMAEMQQKDDEPEAAYRIRKANGENMLELIEKIVTQGEELTIGGRIVDDTGVSEVDFEVAGTSDSRLAKFFQGMVGKKSLFANLLQQPSMMTMAVSWQFDEKQRKAFTELFTFAPDEIDRQASKDGVEGTKEVLAPLFETFLHSAETGHLDGFMRLTGDGPGTFTMLGGLRVTGATNLPKQLQSALQMAKDKFSHNDRIAALELDVERFNGQPIHRMAMTSPDRPGQWMFGDGSAVYAYATTQALWIAFGGEDALKTLKSSVEAAGKPSSQAEDRRQRVPFIFQTQAKQWVTVRTEAGAEEPPANRPRRRQFGQVLNQEMQAAFNDENDGLRIEVRPTDNGARMRLELQPGWIGLMGRLIARQVERGPNRPAADPQPAADVNTNAN